MTIANARSKTDLFYVVEGNGPPLLLMHGGLGFDHTLFRPFFDPLAEHFTLIFYDHRGNGRSPRPDDYAALSHETWVDDAEALRESLGYERWVVFGESYGGVLALEYSLRYPERLDGLILSSTAPVYDHAATALERAGRKASPEQLEKLVRAFSEPAPDNDALENIVRTVIPVYFHRPSDTLISRLLDDVIYSAKAASRSLHECLAGFDVRGRLHEIEVPALVISGEHDWLCPPVHGITPFVESMPNVRPEVFKESGHFPSAEEAERFCVVVTEWLRAIPRMEV